ncbi:WhiB family transcriptional regulator, partial [Streptomyces sp. NPDC017546]
RRAVEHAAYRHGVSEQRLAWLLKVTEEHAKKRYREIRRAERNRTLNQPKETVLPPAVDGEHPVRDDFGTAA